MVHLPGRSPYSHPRGAPPGAVARVASPERRRSREKKSCFGQRKKHSKTKKVVHPENLGKLVPSFFKATVAEAGF